MSRKRISAGSALVNGKSLLKIKDNAATNIVQPNKILPKRALGTKNIPISSARPPTN